VGCLNDIIPICHDGVKGIAGRWKLKKERVAIIFFTPGQFFDINRANRYDTPLRKDFRDYVGRKT
jgi:hypothetical protein